MLNNKGAAKDVDITVNEVTRVSFNVEKGMTFEDVYTWLCETYPEGWQWETITYAPTRKHRWWQIGPWRPLELVHAVVDIGGQDAPFTVVVESNPRPY